MDYYLFALSLYLSLSLSLSLAMRQYYITSSGTAKLCYMLIAIQNTLKCIVRYGVCCAARINIAYYAGIPQSTPHARALVFNSL